jgi:hypothetical protein
MIRVERLFYVLVETIRFYFIIRALMQYFTGYLELECFFSIELFLQ